MEIGRPTHGAAVPTPGRAFIDLFAGCGGLSLGLMRAGWRGLFGIEADAFAFESLKANFLDAPVEGAYDWPSWLPKEPCQVATFTRRYRKQIAELRGKVDLIAGGPPCQGFSLAGRRKKDDRRNGMFRHYVTIVQLIQPKYLLLENVRGIEVEFGKKKRSQTNKRGVGRPPKPFSQKIRESLERVGYRAYPGLVRALDFGVPQRRPRYIVVGVRADLLASREGVDPFSLADATRRAFLKSIGLADGKEVSVREAISDLETKRASLIECVDSPGFRQIAYTAPRTDYQRLLHGAMNGTAPDSLRLANHLEATRERFAKILETCRHGVQLNAKDRERFGLNKRCTVPLDGDRPSHTLTTLPDDILHYSEPRILTVREYARLQSFPDWFRFRGTYTTGGDRRTRQVPRYSQVGNAVPPFLAEAMGNVLDAYDRRFGAGAASGHAAKARDA